MRRKKSKLTDSFLLSSRYQSLLRPLPNQLHCLNQSLSSKFYLFKSPIDNNSLNFIVFSFFLLWIKIIPFLELCPMKTLSFRYNSIVRNRWEDEQCYTVILKNNYQDSINLMLLTNKNQCIRWCNHESNHDGNRCQQRHPNNTNLLTDE